MVTDVLRRAPTCWSPATWRAVARTFGVEAEDSVIELPGVMSRKKQVAPKLLATALGVAPYAPAPTASAGASPQSCSSR